jgi:hypothetical protein
MGTNTNQCNLPVCQLVDPLVKRETVHLVLGAFDRVFAAINSPTDREVESQVSQHTAALIVSSVIAC